MNPSFAKNALLRSRSATGMLTNSMRPGCVGVLMDPRPPKPPELIGGSLLALGILRAMQLPGFEDLATSPDATLDLLALALAAAFRPVDAARALATLDALGEEVAGALRAAGTPETQALALSAVLGTRHGFRG